MHDEAGMLQNVNYAGQPAAKRQVLQTIEMPTLEHPYRCTSLRWHSGSPSYALRSIVKDRDIVYIRATGILQVDKDQRIGYNLVHAVDLPSISPLEERGIIRSRGSSCVHFKPTSDQSVKVFTKAYYEVFGNNLLDSIAVVTVASGLMAKWTSGYCAKQRKLSWLLQRKSVNKEDVISFIGNGEAENKSECRSCKNQFGHLRKAYPCAWCELFICGKCVLPTDILEVILQLTLTIRKMYICPTCDQFVRQVNSYKVARQDIQADRCEKEGNGSTVVDPSRIPQLEEGSSTLSGNKSCAGEVYEFDSDQLATSTEDSLSTFAQLTSSNDNTDVFHSKKRPLEERSAKRGAANEEEKLEILIENVWRGSISELDLNDKERGQQLA